MIRIRGGIRSDVFDGEEVASLWYCFAVWTFDAEHLTGGKFEDGDPLEGEIIVLTLGDFFCREAVAVFNEGGFEEGGGECGVCLDGVGCDV